MKLGSVRKAGAEGQVEEVDGARGKGDGEWQKSTGEDKVTEHWATTTTDASPQLTAIDNADANGDAAEITYQGSTQ